MTGRILRGCAVCGAGFVSHHRNDRYCAIHRPGRGGRGEYERNRALLLADHPPCAIRSLCDGAPATTADHIIPRADGGSDQLSNLRPACFSCNAAGGARVAAERTRLA